MATLYKKSRSPYWYIAYLDQDGKRIHRSTELRHDDRRQTAQANTLKAKIEEKAVMGESRGIGDEWETWVPAFLHRHCRSPRTLENYEDRWKWLGLFLTEKKLRRPEQVQYRHASEYVAWRTGWKKRNTRKQVTKNTALLDLRLLSVVMQEAVKLGFIASNPVAKPGIPRDLPQEKPEIKEKEFQTIRADLEHKDEWMRVSFEIAAATGCRLRETVIALKDVDLKRGTILFRPKGGEGRNFTAPLPTVLRPMFEKMKAEGRKTTLTMPFQPSRAWRNLFDRLKMPHLCFHCLRVTYVTRLARSGVPLSAAMRLVNHSSQVVHRIYQRLGVDDVRQYADVASGGPMPGAATPESR